MLAHRGCLSKEASRYWNALMKWDAVSVLSKTKYAGVSYALCQVGVSTGMVVFLAWFNEATRDWDIFWAVSILFVVEILLFLAPPVAGIPLYLMSALVLIPRLQRRYNFVWCVGITTAFCVVLKLTATGLEQKAIGGPLRNNVAIKKFIGVHTPFMKAIRFILTQEGLKLSKVAVLCGGPDWPTSVITGVLGLPMCSMLAGTLPVCFMILPCIMAGAYMMDEDESERSQLAQQVWLGLAAATQAAAGFVAAWYVNRVVEEHQAQLNDQSSGWMQDHQEAEINAELEKEERRLEL